MNANVENLQNMPYEVIQDKALATQDELFKLIIIGDTGKRPSFSDPAGVGKSCLLARVMDNQFKCEHQVTIGVEFGSFIVRLEGKVVKLQIWDTAGQESFRSITRIFYRGAQAVFLVYDITREETFTNVQDWLKEIKQHAAPDVLVYLIGNRADEEDKRQVQQSQAQEFCQRNKIANFFETSAMTGFNVEDVFSLAAKELYIAKKESETEDEPTPSGTNKNSKKPRSSTAGGGGVSLKDAPKKDSAAKSGGCCN